MIKKFSLLVEKKINKNKYFDKYIVFLSVLSLVLLASVIRYGLRTFKIPEWDEQHYMQMAVGFYRLLQNPSLSTPYDMLQIVPFRQPGYPLAMQPFLMFFGLSHSYFWGIFVNGLFYISTIFGIYFIAKNYMSSLSSFLAAFIFSFFGWVLLHVHVTYSETATSALAVWSILFLIKSNYFQNKKYSLLFGLFLGLGLLIKWIVLVYVAGYILYVFFHIMRKRLIKKTIINISMAFLITFLVAFYPYYMNSQWMFNYFYEHRKGGPMWQIVPEHERNPLSLYSLTYYLNTFAQLGIVQFTLFIIGIFIVLVRKSKLQPVLLTLIVAYAFSCAALLKAERHIVPIFPYIAILSASVFEVVKPKFYRRLLIGFVMLISIFTFLGSAWGKGPMKQSLVSLPIQLPFGRWDKIYLTSISNPPYIYKISGREILEFIEKDSRESNIKDPQILSLFYYRSLDEPLMTYNLYNREKPFQITNFIGTTIVKPDVQAKHIVLNTIGSADYILIKSTKKVDHHFSENNYDVLKSVIILFEQNIKIDEFYEKKAQFWIYQDSTEVTVFKKKKEITKEDMQKIIKNMSQILKNTELRRTYEFN